MEVTKVKSKTIIGNSHIFKPGYHMNFGKKRIEKAIYNKFPFESLGNVSASVFTGGIFKRVFVDDPEYGHPYISAQHMMNSNPLDVAKIISKKYTPRQEEMSLKENQILVSCAGTIGNVRLITKDLTGVIGSQDIIRVDPNNIKLPYGYLYAYLASKTAYNYMQSYIYGSVVPRIEPKTLSRLPIPILSEEKQQKIHQLIVEASELRVEANRLLKEAQNKITSKLDFGKNKISEKFFITDIITSHQTRFESQYHKSIGSYYRDKILNSEHILLKNASEDIFRPGIFKRNYVKDGVDFLGGSDIAKSIPDSDKKLSKRNTPNFKELILKEDWILVTCGGTIGTSVLVNSYLATKLASQHILRVIPKNIKTGYLYAFLSSEIGVKVIQSFTYGSVIPQIEPHHLTLVPLPLLDEELMDRIHLDIMKYKFNLNEAIIKENQAIALIEKEIDLWQVS